MNAAIVFSALKTKCGSICACSAVVVAVVSSDSCSCAESWSPSASRVSTAVSSSGEPAVAKATTAPAGPSLSRSGTTAAAPSGHAGWLHSVRRPSGASSGPPLRERLVDRADRLVARGVVVGAGADERQHLVRVGDRDGAVAELLEQLVGDGAGGALGQPAPKLRQRRLEQLEHRRLAPRPAHARHGRDCARTEDLSRDSPDMSAPVVAGDSP